MNGTQDGHAKIYTDWHQLEGASWMASFHAEFFFLLLFIFLIRFVLLLFAYVAWFERDWNKKKDQKKKENIAFLAFSWIEGFFCCWWWWLYTQSSFYSFGAYIIIYLLDLFLFLFLLFPSRSLLSMDGETQSMFLEYSAECEFGLAGYIYQVLRRLNKQVQSPFLNAI